MQTYTQYIPLSIYDLQTWIGAPSIYVYDCSNAGMIVKLFNQFAEQHHREVLVNNDYILFLFRLAHHHVLAMIVCLIYQFVNKKIKSAIKVVYTRILCFY